MSRAASTFSGNDAYDLAAGAFPGLFVASFGGSLSGDAAYDAAAGGLVFGSAGSMSRAASTFSGNDAYDLAAGAFPGLFLVSFGGSLSGDAAYDAAAGGLAGLSSFGASEAAFCEPGDLAIAGGYGGDDAYDGPRAAGPGGEQAPAGLLRHAATSPCRRSGVDRFDNPRHRLGGGEPLPAGAVFCCGLGPPGWGPQREPAPCLGYWAQLVTAGFRCAVLSSGGGTRVRNEWASFANPCVGSCSPRASVL